MPTNFTNYTNSTKSISKNLDLLYKEEVFRIIGAAMEVQNNLGSGFLEPVYQETLGIEFGIQQIPFRAQVPLTIQYKGHTLEKFYVADFIVYERILIEIKAAQHLAAEHISQVLNYLQATHFELGVLINFGAKSLEWKRIVN